jgi:hypothetical protein
MSRVGTKTIKQLKLRDGTGIFPYETAANVRGLVFTRAATTSSNFSGDHLRPSFGRSRKTVSDLPQWKTNFHF